MEINPHICIGIISKQILKNGFYRYTRNAFMVRLSRILSEYSPALLAACLFLLLTSCSTTSVKPVWSAEDGNIFKDGKSEYFIGTNLWYAGRLAADEKGRERLNRELDALKEMGVTNLRVLATEGEDADCLAYALDRMQERGMCAVLFLNNAWEWSYGFAGYLEAAGAGVQPRPSVEGYPAYMQAMAAFSVSEKPSNSTTTTSERLLRL